MDSVTMNRYEKQLYIVFKTFDVDNEEALDRSAVHQLCDALQLEERGAALVNSLFERRSGRVTFTQFRNGLLAALGDATVTAASAAGPSPEPKDPPDPPHSDDDSLGREVAPRFVYGSKKYGRRSRPQRAEAPPSPVRSSSASRLDSDDRRSRQRPRCRRSASAMDARDGDGDAVPGVEHDRRIDRDEALELCRGLDMDRIDRRLVERIFEDSGAADTTVGEFFDRLNASLTATAAEAARAAPVPPEADDEPSDDESAGVGLGADFVAEAWRRIGVPAPRRLLADLGFAGAALRPRDLERALDEELRSAPEAAEARALPAAALALARLRLERARRRAAAAAAERDKLRSDVAEANRRASVLAQEIDESQARIETELRANLRKAEVRQAEAARLAAAAVAAEREAAAVERERLEAEVARRADAEARARDEADAARRRADESESRVGAAEDRATRAEREASRLAAELSALRADSRAPAPAAAPEAPAVAAELLRDNQRLRDRVDELCAALESRGRSSSPAPATGDLSAELNPFLTSDLREECDSSPASLDPSIAGLTDAPPPCRACETAARRRDAGPPREGAGRGPPSARVDRATQTDAAAASDALRPELLEAERRHDDEKRKLNELVRELEGGLELMRAEYDKCEEYWSGKLREEREALAEEQRAGDQRLADLAARINDYERQFARAALPTIDERHSLEAQFTQLEEEFARYRAESEAQLAEAARRSCELEARLAAAAAAAAAAAGRPRRRARGPPPASQAEAEELRARTARAEAAVRRLNARLATADLLVKDLYVENCQLAHRPL